MVSKTGAREGEERRPSSSPRYVGETRDQLLRFTLNRSLFLASFVQIREIKRNFAGFVN